MSVVSEAQKSQSSVTVAEYDVVVVGAGPYGLSTAAHLMGRGLKVAIFGKPLELWREHMPKGMFLRSHWWATNLSDPKKKYSFANFFKVSEYKACYPVPIQEFIDYGMWFQKKAVPNVDETYVASIERKDRQFVVTLEDGRVVQSHAVVMAIGVYTYANRPEEFSHMPTEMLSHSFEHKEFSRFVGKTVAVVGGGQSAVENSALLNEEGATVHLISIRPIHWLARDRADERTWLEQIKAPNSGIAPGWKNWVLEYMPYLFYRYPQERKSNYIKNHYQAAASDWLRDRIIGKVNLYEDVKIERMSEKDGRVELALSNGKQLTVDHVMLGTGYEVNINNLTMLSPSLRSEIKATENAPELDAWFESSVPGLYFVGLSSLRNFGPLYRFVVGTKAAAPRVAKSVARRVAQVRAR